MRRRPFPSSCPFRVLRVFRCEPHCCALARAPPSEAGPFLVPTSLSAATQPVAGQRHPHGRPASIRLPSVCSVVVEAPSPGRGTWHRAGAQRGCVDVDGGGSRGRGEGPSLGADKQRREATQEPPEPRSDDLIANNQQPQNTTTHPTKPTRSTAGNPDHQHSEKQT